MFRVPLQRQGHNALQKMTAIACPRDERVCVFHETSRTVEHPEGEVDRKDKDQERKKRFDALRRDALYLYRVHYFRPREWLCEECDRGADDKQAPVQNDVPTVARRILPCFGEQVVKRVAHIASSGLGLRDCERAKRTKNTALRGVWSIRSVGERLNT